jgi:hypothetical protein
MLTLTVVGSSVPRKVHPDGRTVQPNGLGLSLAVQGKSAQPAELRAKSPFGAQERPRCLLAAVWELECIWPLIRPAPSATLGQILRT